MNKRLGKFPRIAILAFCIFVLSCLLGRNHFLLGTALIAGRWLYMVFGICFIYMVFKRDTPKYLKWFLISIMALLLMEFSWNRLNEQSLDSLENENSTTLTIMTYNLFFKNGAPNSSIKNIQEVNPDILVIQEVTPTWEKDLDQTIGVQYPYKMTLALKGTHGIGVYSKYPLKSNQYLPAGSKYPFAQMLEIEVNSKRIQLVSVHLASPAAAVEQPDKFLRLISKSYVEREKQIREINALMEYDSFDAQIFIGDLNTTQYEPLYRKLTNDWVDLFEEVGVGSKRNFPNTSKMKPVLTLDYIFIRGKAKAIESNVIQGGSSDHLALSGKFEI